MESWTQEMNGGRWRSRTELGDLGSWTVPPPWKLYFNPWTKWRV